MTTTVNQIRSTFLDYFAKNGHKIVPSSPLVPDNDPTLMFTNSGMVQFKNILAGNETRDYTRAASSQKSVRAGGKHNDLDSVGYDVRHHTFFEMLGNFSFGDYFKEGAISYAWELLTKYFDLPADRLAVTIYHNDEEAYALWKKISGLPDDRIIRIATKDNFWQMGDTGPCGPCSEIFYDHGPEVWGGLPGTPEEDGDRFIEIWNLVFDQFEDLPDGSRINLKKPSIDTGMGLERIAAILQGVHSNFDIDLFRNLIKSIADIANSDPEGPLKASHNVIADHLRSAAFLIADGVLPSNEGRGYVLRRIIRRACRHGKQLGINRPFLTELCEVAIGENVGPYPELGVKAEYIKKVLSIEEKRFDATLDAGLAILSNIIRGAAEKGSDTISGEDAFKLYDTFGFPLDLTREIAIESKLTIDEETFGKLMLQQKTRARESRANIGGWSESSKTLLSDMPKTRFTGYTSYRTKAKILAILGDEGAVDTVNEGDCTIILDATPFYGEGGGQIGDTGTMYAEGKLLNVYDTHKADGVYIHLCTVVNGSFSVGDTVMADIDDMRRKAIARNHSACHLLQASLRRALGAHVEQAGSYVSDTVCRFDFTHFSAMSQKEIASVEAMVNMNILAANEITTVETDLETAKKHGAMALFGEKYGNVVRMVQMGDFSTELCGGTHCSNTGEIGLFKIISESSVAAGVRRIEAVTGLGVLRLMAEKDKLITDTAHALKAQNTLDIAKRAEQLTDELAAAKRELETMNARLAATQLDSFLAKSVQVGSVMLAAGRFDGMTLEVARSLADKVKAEHPDTVAVLAINTDGKLNFIAVCGAGAVKAGAHAGKIVSAVAAVTGGKGGGRPDNAMAGGRDAEKINEALGTALSVLTGLVSK